MVGDSFVEVFRVKCDGYMAHALDHWDDSKNEAVTTWNAQDLRVKFGGIELSKLDSGLWFISDENGEGMEISERAIEKMAQRYKQENF